MLMDWKTSLKGSVFKSVRNHTKGPLLHKCPRFLELLFKAWSFRGLESFAGYQAFREDQGSLLQSKGLENS